VTMMNKRITQSDTAIADGWNVLDLPNTRVWYTVPQRDEPPSDSRRLPGSARYAALAAFVVAGGVAVLATYQRPAARARRLSTGGPAAHGMATHQRRSSRSRSAGPGNSRSASAAPAAARRR
jgi:hypothetical protein